MKHTTPEIVDMPAEMREKLLVYRKEHANDPLGGVADRVIFEDDTVRIWDMTLEPGQFSALHRHDHPYYLLIESGAVGQRIYLAANAAGLAARNLAAFRDDDLNALLGLDGRNRAVLHLTLSGYATPGSG